MLSTVMMGDHKLQPRAVLALDESLGSRARRAARVVGTRLEARLLIGSAAAEVFFAGRLAAECGVRTMLVVPIEDQPNFSPHGLAL